MVYDRDPSANWYASDCLLATLQLPLDGPNERVQTLVAETMRSFDG